MRIFEKKPNKYPCQAINLVEDGKNNWYMCYYKTSMKDHEAYGDYTYEEYGNPEQYYYDESGLAYWKAKNDLSSEMLVKKPSTNLTYYHIIVTEYDAIYEGGYYYKHKPKGMKFKF